MRRAEAGTISSLDRWTRGVLGLVAGLSLASPATLAHHGWEGLEPDLTEMYGEVREMRRANPHSELSLEVGGSVWVVELGQPWRNKRAGLPQLEPGLELRVQGHRSIQADQRRFRAVRVVVDGRNYDLYPGRLR